jgi:hypothetical protein
MTPSAQTAGGRRVTRWTRDSIIAKIAEWNHRYGEPPSSADWNPSLARWRAQEWRAERYREGVWPSTNAAKRPFGGSFDAAVRAAGLTPHRPGPRRRLAALNRAPDVEQRAPLAPAGVAAELAAAAERVARAEARAAKLERRLAKAEARAERAESTVGAARRRARLATEQAGRARRARDRARSLDAGLREAAVEEAERAIEDADARVRAAADQSEAALRDAAADRARAREAAERAAGAETRALAAERSAAAARAELAAAGDAGEAQRAARRAEERAAASERRERELARLVCGERRALRPEEVARLRAGGPSGPVVLAGALRALGRARAGGDRAGLVRALGDVASAAVRWRDSL